MDWRPTLNDREGPLYRRIVDATEPLAHWEFGGEEWEWFRRLLAAISD